MELDTPREGRLEHTGYEVILDAYGILNPQYGDIKPISNEVTDIKHIQANSITEKLKEKIPDICDDQEIATTIPELLQKPKQPDQWFAPYLYNDQLLAVAPKLKSIYKYTPKNSSESFLCVERLTYTNPPKETPTYEYIGVLTEENSTYIFTTAGLKMRLKNLHNIEKELIFREPITQFQYNEL